MKRLLRTLAAAAALLAAPAFTFAVEDKSAEEHTEGGAREVWKGMLKLGTGDDEYAAMKSQLDLTDSQESALKNRLKERREALAEWDETHRKETNEIASRWRKARREKDDSAIDAARDDLRSLLRERRDLQDKHDVEVLDTLTESQRQKWDEYRLKQAAYRRYDREDIDLTDEQENAIATRARMAARDIRDDVKLEDLNGRRERAIGFFKGIEDEVLTEAQRDKYLKSRELAREAWGAMSEKERKKKLGEAIREGEDEDFAYRYLYY
jgi:Spy/CpxP family protein refolding chaperone